MLIVIAEKEELKLVEELGYGDFPILITGVGGMNVIQALKDLPRNTTILNIGYAGSNNLPIGTKVAVNTCQTNRETANFGEGGGLLGTFDFPKGFVRCPCYTSTDFVTHTNKKESCVFDMELAFIWALFDNVSAIKVVSDNLSYKEFKGE
jgi:hypothetical protein